MNNFCTFYIVRHGETDWNVKGLLQGHLGADLNKNGQKQAKKLANKLKNIHFDAIFSSDLIRAKQTAEIIALERKLAVEATKLLRERTFGPFEGKPYASLKEFDKTLDRLTDEEKRTHKAHPDMESDEELVGRFITFLREVAIGYEGKNILVVTHGGMMRTILIHTGFETYESLSYEKSKVTNAASIVLKSDGVEFEVVKTVGIEKRQA